MIRTFIADASVAVGWVHPGQATTHTASMLDAIAAGTIVEVPALWPLEVANALTRSMRFDGTAMRTILTGVARGSAPMNTPGER